MAYFVDIMNALRTDIRTVLAPLSSEYKHTVFKGWPGRNQLKQLENGHTLISIFPPRGMTKRLDRYASTPFRVEACYVSGYVDGVEAQKSVTKHLTVNNEVVFAFAAKAANELLVEGDNIGFRLHRPLFPNTDVCVFHHIGVGGETVETALAAVKTEFDADYAADVPWLNVEINGRDLVILYPFPAVPDSSGFAPASETITGAIGGQATWLSEIKRQQRGFWVTIWAPSPTIRDVFGRALDAYFGDFIPSNAGAYAEQSNRLMLPDGTCATMFYNDDFIVDDEQSQKNWRQTFVVYGEYATTREVGMWEIVGVPVGAGVLVIVGIGVEVGVSVDVGVGVAVRVNVGVGVTVGVSVEVAVFVDTPPGVKVEVEVGVGVGVAVGVGVNVNVGGGSTSAYNSQFTSLPLRGCVGLPFAVAVSAIHELPGIVCAANGKITDLSPGAKLSCAKPVT